MRTISQHISNIRGLLKLYSRTPEGYTDQFLYNLLSVCRADIIKQQFDKFKAVHEDNYIQVCIPLEIGVSHNCDCVPEHLECKILKTKYEVPTALVGRNKSRISFRTIGGKQVNLVSEAEWFRRKDRETSEYFGSIINKHLIIWNAPLTLKVILASAIWSDVSDLINIPNCSMDGQEGQNACYNPLEDVFPLQDEYTKPVYMEILKLLNIPQQTIQDITNNSNEFLKV